MVPQTLLRWATRQLSVAVDVRNDGQGVDAECWLVVPHAASTQNVLSCVLPRAWLEALAARAYALRDRRDGEASR